jgi:hypothetical protein
LEPRPCSMEQCESLLTRDRHAKEWGQTVWGPAGSIEDIIHDSGHSCSNGVLLRVYRQAAVTKGHTGAQFRITTLVVFVVEQLVLYCKRFDGVFSTAQHTEYHAIPQSLYWGRSMNAAGGHVDTL